jgi:hypothetical protein
MYLGGRDAVGDAALRLAQASHAYIAYMHKLVFPIHRPKFARVFFVR